jgi:hypothetical protein
MSTIQYWILAAVLLGFLTLGGLGGSAPNNSSKHHSRGTTGKGMSNNDQLSSSDCCVLNLGCCTQNP